MSFWVEYIYKVGEYTNYLKSSCYIALSIIIECIKIFFIYFIYFYFFYKLFFFIISPDSQSVGTGNNVANPSIAPSIGDASLGMTNSLSASGSHMDRVGIIRDEISDRDSASNRAIGGFSLNGSLCGGSYYPHK
jgi:hypothetical protein